MSVNLQKERINLSEVVCSRYCQTTAECDINVPDIKPDVLKVLRANCEAVLTHKTVQTDKVHLQGILRLDILYIPDGTALGKVKAITATHDFSHTVDAPGAKPGMTLVAEVACDIPECNLTNSRKLNVRCKIGMNIKVTSASEVYIATGIDDNDAIQTRCEHLKISNSCCFKEHDFVIRERLELPQSKPDIAEVLRFSAKPLSGELRLLDNKAVLKGEVRLCTLYCGDDGEESMQCMEHTIPFTEITEFEGSGENMLGEVDYVVKELSYEICRDPDGDKRILSAEVTLCACLRAGEIIECDAIRDAYSLDTPIKAETSTYKMEQLIDTATAQAPLKEKIAIPDYLPDIFQMCDCTAIPDIENISTDNNGVCVSGYITCNILYMCAEQDTPLSGFSHVLPFSHTFDVSGVSENSICDVKTDIEHIEYAISGPRDIEIRAIVSLSMKAVCPSNCEFISEIEYDENVQVSRIPAIVVYYIQPGDTLWSIAKRFRTTPEALLATNNVDPENLQIGSRIYIFR